MAGSAFFSFVKLKLSRSQPHMQPLLFDRALVQAQALRTDRGPTSTLREATHLRSAARNGLVPTLNPRSAGTQRQWKLTRKRRSARSSICACGWVAAARAIDNDHLVHRMSFYLAQILNVNSPLLVGAQTVPASDVGWRNPCAYMHACAMHVSLELLARLAHEKCTYARLHTHV